MLLEFVDCDTIDGKSICEKIFQPLRRLNLQPELCRAQTYDGDGDMYMAGILSGCSAYFLKEVPQAIGST